MSVIVEDFGYLILVFDDHGRKKEAGLTAIGRIFEKIAAERRKAARRCLRLIRGIVDRGAAAWVLPMWQYFHLLGERGRNAKSQPERGKENMMPTSKDDFAELRATLLAMAKNEDQFDFSWVIGRLVDLGHVVLAKAKGTPIAYRIVGFDSLDECDHLISTIKNPLQAALVQLAVLNVLHFSAVADASPGGPDLRWHLNSRSIELTGRSAHVVARLQ